LEGENYGSIILISDTLGVYGKIEAYDRIFELNSMDGSKVSILSEIEKVNNLGCGSIESKNKVINEIPLKERNLPCVTSQIRVLVVYTSNASNAAGNVQTVINRVNTSIAGFNSANNVSGVTNPDANIVISSIESTTYGEQFRGLTLANANLPVVWNAFRLATQNRKVQTNSDIVFCACDHNWTNLLGLAAGFATTSDLNSMAVGDVDNFQSLPILQHEIGHLFGGYHNNDPNAPSNTKGHQYAFPVNSNTLMVAGGFPGSRPNRWSNPNIIEFGVPTGVAGISNVAAIINQNATAIAAIRPEPQILYSNITGPNGVYTISSHSYVINFGCSFNHTFQWATSTNGYSYTPVFNNTSVLGKTFTPADNGTFYVRCIVTGGDGQVSTSFKSTLVNVQSFKIGKDGVNAKGIDGIVAFPNPAHSSLKILKNNLSKGNLLLTISNLSGTLVYSKEYMINENAELDTDITTEDFKSGFYIITLQQSDRSTSTKISILK
jgi:hypothetical protein